MTGPGVWRRRPARRALLEGAVASHKPCPVDDCPGRPRPPERSAAAPAAFGHGGTGPGHDTALCARCGAGPCAPAEA
ncbi:MULTISPECIES: hypothetical protein [unclassified Streptomyces]|uniref:hypothetical protein n=1 Tax=unclassified Streptomyces TaxID=2593676 RepID=UPI00332B1C52